ncbi:MAG: FAD-dependent oxidoreductase [Pseudomonadota bacterium]
MSDVYDINRIVPADAPAEFPDDVADTHFVPAPCQVACPIGTDAPSYLAYIWEDKFEEAFEAITATNPFSSICGRVCDAPCEPACRRADSDGPIAIRNLKRYVMERLGKDFTLPEIEVVQTKTVGIVGSGPAGLTAAQDLAEAGYEVHVYEMTDRLGGMMVWGIPAFRLPVGTIEEDLNRMMTHCPGIKVHLNCALGRDVTLDELKQRHDAVLLTIGSWWGKAMGVPGEADSRVVDGVAFLRRINAGERPELPETVVVVGGGDVAMDACRSALRMPGCERVKVVYRRTPEEIPARRDELEGALKEGIEFVYNTLQLEVIEKGNGLALKCVLTAPGEPDADGRRRPVPVEGSEHHIDCGMVIAAVGQQAESDELAGQDLMAKDRVKTAWDTMRTDDEKVFAAGDGAFGGSTIVMAMQHGHRAAYYMKAFLEGRENPVPYRTPFRTRRVPVAQDPLWEMINRQEQEFHGVGDNPVAFPEIESTYNRDEARAEAARCFRCDAETGTVDYSVRNREDIFVMARTAPKDAAKHTAMLQKRLQPRPNPFAEDEPASFEHLVFLPANLSRLVIDPYRDDCRVAVNFAFDKLQTASPTIVTGFDEAPEEVREDLAASIAEHGSLYLGAASLPGDGPWLQHVTGDALDPGALGYIAEPGALDVLNSAAKDKATGTIARAGDLEATLKAALEAELDVLVLDGTGALGGTWPELATGVDLALLRDAIALLRAWNREEDIDLLFFGGVRSGTDVAKLVGLGACVSVLGVAMGLAMGGTIQDGGLTFYGDMTSEDRQLAAANLLKALAGEASIMARCTGKTDVQNLEPEDLRAITVTTARAAGIPLAGTQTIPEAPLAAE